MIGGSDPGRGRPDSGWGRRLWWSAPAALVVGGTMSVIALFVSPSVAGSVDVPRSLSLGAGPATQPAGKHQVGPSALPARPVLHTPPAVVAAGIPAAGVDPIPPPPTDLDVPAKVVPQSRPVIEVPWTAAVRWNPASESPESPDSTGGASLVQQPPRGSGD